jgi:hypothetical protein
VAGRFGGGDDERLATTSEWRPRPRLDNFTNWEGGPRRSLRCPARALACWLCSVRRWRSPSDPAVRRSNGPWRTTRGGGHRFLSQQASMRPRPRGRGERGRRCRPFPSDDRFNAATAQGPWRTSANDYAYVATTNCFNAATAQGPWRTSANRSAVILPTLLQCGHGSGAVENQQEAGDGKAVHGASMRPRLRGRGEPLVPAFVPLTVLVASMRPRLRGRGEPVRRGQRKDAERRFNAATAQGPWRTCHPQ